MKPQQRIPSVFSSWKIKAVLVFTLAIFIFLLYKALSERHFAQVAKGKGSFEWVDVNQNHQVDFANSLEFKAVKHGDYKQLTSLEMLRSIPWTKQTTIGLILAFVFMIGRDLAYMWRIRILTSNQLSWRTSFRTIMLWEFASALAPGVASGSTVAMFILHREKIPLGKSTAIVMITTMMDNLFYVLIIPFIFLFVTPNLLFPATDAFHKNVEWLFWSAYAIFLTLTIVLFTSIFFVPKLISRLLRVIFHLPFLKKWQHKAIETGREVEETARIFKREKWTFWFKVFLSTCLSWTSRYLVINAILAAFLSIGLVEHVFVLAKQFILWLMMRVSPTPGGSGVAEYAFGELMKSFSTNGFLLLVLAIIWRLISYFPYLLIGSLILPKWIKKRQKDEL